VPHDFAAPESKRRPPPPPEPALKPSRRLEAFRAAFQLAAPRALRRLPGELSPTTYVIGVPVIRGKGEAIVEPADARLAGALAQLDDRIAEVERGLGDTDRDALGLGRAEIVSAAVTELLAQNCRRTDRRIFCAGAVRVRTHYVIPVLQVRRDAYEALPKMRADERGPGHGVLGFADALVAAVLRSAEEELAKPNPGRSLYWLDPDVLARAAGTAVLFEVAAAGHEVGDAHALLDRLNVISATHYERRVGRGHIVVARPDHPALRYKLRLAAPVPLGEPQWTRKLLEMASDGVGLISDSANVLGLGAVSEEYDAAAEDLFEVSFFDHYKWELRHAEKVLMRVEYGTPGLPHPPLRRAALHAVVARIFPETTPEVDKRFFRIVEAAMTQPHGTMIVVSARAAEEAERLSSQCTRVEPVVLSDDMVRRVTSIDGAVLLDDEGRCHAVGVILDGRATEKGRPARGARYHSATRYVSDAASPTIAVVVSEDGRVDVLPEP
jgi:hypothetical protein